MIAALIAWWALPRFWPAKVIAYSLWPGPAFIAMRHTREADDRRAFMARLPDWGVGARSLLLRELDDPSERVARQAAAGLRLVIGKGVPFKPSSSRRILAQVADSEYAKVRLALLALVVDEELPGWQGLVRDRSEQESNAYALASAIRALGRLDDAADEARLRQAITDWRPEVRLQGLMRWSAAPVPGRRICCSGPLVGISPMW